MKSDISSLRNEYSKLTLSDTELSKNPFTQFDTWFKEVVNSDQIEPTAMIVGTVDQQKQPTQRTVLLKDYSEEGFTFYTNYKSRKGIQLEENPKINLLFPWYHLQRQVIISGTIAKVSRENSEQYFHSRPRGSQLSAFVSNQSEEISSREELESKLQKAKEEFAKKEVPLPQDWGGYLVTPTSFEFWQGRENRLHDRFFYELLDSQWKISRLAP